MNEGEVMFFYVFWFVVYVITAVGGVMYLITPTWGRRDTIRQDALLRLYGRVLGAAMVVLGCLRLATLVMQGFSTDFTGAWSMWSVVLGLALGVVIVTTIAFLLLRLHDLRKQ
jgi:amino acid transporter